MFKSWQSQDLVFKIRGLTKSINHSVIVKKSRNKGSNVLILESSIPHLIQESKLVEGKRVGYLQILMTLILGSLTTFNNPIQS